MSKRAIVVRIVDAIRCGWLAALARWRGTEPVAERKRTSWFDLPPGALQLPRSEGELEIERIDRKLFGNFPVRQK